MQAWVVFRQYKISQYPDISAQKRIEILGADDHQAASLYNILYRSKISTSLRLVDAT